VTGAIGNSRVATPTALLVMSACIVGAALLTAGVASGATRASTGQQKLTIYSVPSKAQFLNNADDRRRSIIANPFTTNTAKLMAVMKGEEKRTGPLPGDTLLYSFSLYTSANLKKTAGSSVYTCQYNFSSNAICTAYFELNDGTVVAQGKVNYFTLKDKKFTLSVRGGTDAYLGARGEVTVLPSARVDNARRLDFVMLPR
jgi:hypothetical protein